MAECGAKRPLRILYERTGFTSCQGDYRLAMTAGAGRVYDAVTPDLREYDIMFNRKATGKSCANQALSRSRESRNAGLRENKIKYPRMRGKEENEDKYCCRGFCRGFCR